MSSRAALVESAHEVRRLQARLDQVWDDEHARMDTWAALRAAIAQFDAAAKDVRRSIGMDDEQQVGMRSMVEARTLASGHTTYVVRVVPGETTIEELRDAIDLAQQALLYATTEDDDEDEEDGA